MKIMEIERNYNGDLLVPSGYRALAARDTVTDGTLFARYYENVWMPALNVGDKVPTDTGPRTYLYIRER